MPIYVYSCDQCKSEFELLRKISQADEDAICPNCGNSLAKRKVTAAAFRLKGGGWYESDFKTSNQKNLVKDDNSSNKTPSSGNGGCCNGGSCPHK